MALISSNDLEARLGRSLTADELTEFGVLNSSVQRAIEEWIGSSVEEAETSYRYYDGGYQHLTIDPCTDVEEIALVDDDLGSAEIIDSTDYQIEPVNRTLKTYLRYRAGKIYRGINNIRVKAKFSIYADEGVRNIVKDALLDMLTWGLTNKDEVAKESIEGYSVEYIRRSESQAIKSLRLLFPEV